MTKAEKIKTVVWEAMRVSKTKDHKQIRLTDKTLVDIYIKKKIDIIDNIAEDSKIFQGLLEAARGAKQEIQENTTNFWYAELINRFINLPLELLNKKLVEKEKASDETIAKMIANNEKIYQAKMEEKKKARKELAERKVVVEKVGVTGKKLEKRKKEFEEMNIDIENFEFDDDETKLDNETEEISNENYDI